MMNKLTTLVAPINRLFLVVIFLLMSNSSAFSQEAYTIIRENINPLASELNNSLSDSQDSLLLQNKYLFNKVCFLNKTTEKVFDFKPAVKSAKISLEDLPLGQYTVMFYEADKIIVFQLDRILPFNYYSKLDIDVTVANADIEDVILNDDVPNISKNVGLNLDHGFSSIANKNIDKDYQAFKEKTSMTYNITEKYRSKVQTRAQYRSTHLRPNGKPYND